MHCNITRAYKILILKREWKILIGRPRRRGKTVLTKVRKAAGLDVIDSNHLVEFFGTILCYGCKLVRKNVMFYERGRISWQSASIRGLCSVDNIRMMTGVEKYIF
jgi:hypothetical protein